MVLHAQTAILRKQNPIPTNIKENKTLMKNMYKEKIWNPKSAD